MTVLVDAALSTTPKDQLASRVFLSVLPQGRVGQIIGLALKVLLQDGLNTVTDSDQIFMMSQRRIVEHGTPRGILRDGQAPDGNRD